MVMHGETIQACLKNPARPVIPINAHFSLEVNTENGGVTSGRPPPLPDLESILIFPSAVDSAAVCWVVVVTEDSRVDVGEWWLSFI